MIRAGQLTQTIRELMRGRREHEWLEFKVNDLDPQEVGSYISALANCAAIAEQPYGYVVWGIADATYDVVGTTIDPWQMKVGNEDLLPWLRRGTSPDTTDFQFHTVEIENQRLIVLVIERATMSPVQFKGVEYIRDGSYTKDLRNFPLKARELWRSFERTPFEELVCHPSVPSAQIAELLNLDAYLSLTEQAASANLDEQLKYLAADRLTTPAGSGLWDITDLGALALARRLDEFPTLSRKAVRFVAYAGNNRSEAIDQVDGIRGYAAGFEGLLNHIDGRLPRREVTDPIRRMQEHFPRISVRELIANALIHQDFTIHGSGPLVELFQDRLEITSPGAPLLEDTRRLLDSPSRSRNERLATFMRKARICEERGSGIDKAALAAEDTQLPAPRNTRRRRPHGRLAARTADTQPDGARRTALVDLPPRLVALRQPGRRHQRHRAGPVRHRRPQLGPSVAPATRRRRRRAHQTPRPVSQPQEHALRTILGVTLSDPGP